MRHGEPRRRARAARRARAYSTSQVVKALKRVVAAVLSCRNERAAQQRRRRRRRHPPSLETRLETVFALALRARRVKIFYWTLAGLCTFDRCLLYRATAYAQLSARPRCPASGVAEVYSILTREEGARSLSFAGIFAPERSAGADPSALLEPTPPCQPSQHLGGALTAGPGAPLLKPAARDETARTARRRREAGGASCWQKNGRGRLRFPKQGQRLDKDDCDFLSFLQIQDLCCVATHAPHKSIQMY
eukprot:COSAG06_NODE_7076_length_2644_cov_1.548527_4_plen_246_part_01